MSSPTLSDYKPLSILAVSLPPKVTDRQVVEDCGFVEMRQRSQIILADQNRRVPQGRKIRGRRGGRVRDFDVDLFPIFGLDQKLFVSGFVVFDHTRALPYSLRVADPNPGPRCVQFFQ